MHFALRFALTSALILGLASAIRPAVAADTIKIIYPTVSDGRAVTAPAPLADVLEFSAATYSVDEGGATVTITVQRVGGSVGGSVDDVAVNYTTSNGTATAGSDYTTTSGNLFWFPNDINPRTFTIPILQDAAVEGNESFTLALSGATNSATSGGTATVTIVDDDATVAFAAATSSVTEGTPGSVDITVTRSGGTAAEFTVGYTTAAGIVGTAGPGFDYTTTLGTLTFAAGEPSKTITVPILNDSIVEAPSETFTVTLINAVASVGTVALGAQATNTVTILDDDTIFTFSAPTYSGAENGGAITVAVTRSGNVDNAAAQTVAYASADGTATGSDYAAFSSTLNFAVGDVSATFTLTPTADTTVEADETVNLFMRAQNDNSTLGAPNTAVLTITNDDTNVQFAAATYSEVEGVSPTTITITRTGVISVPSTVFYATSNGTATAGLDYTTTT